MNLSNFQSTETFGKLLSAIIFHTFLQVHKVPEVKTTLPDVKPEDIEALAKAATGQKKRKIGFADDTIEENDNKESIELKESDLNQQKVIVELDSDASTPKKKKFKKKKKKQTVVAE